MDHVDFKTSDSEIDLECGEATSEEERYKGSDNTNARKLLKREWSGLLNLDSTEVTKSSDSYRVSSSCNDLVLEMENEMLKKVESELLNYMDKRMGKEKRKKTGYKLPSKPPRPPKGPSLDAADIKMVREFSELAALKRKRFERMKTLRKLKAEKGWSLGNVFAMIVTVLFCFVIISQGLLGSRA